MNDEITKILEKKRPTGTDIGRLIFFIDMGSIRASRNSEEFLEKITIQWYIEKYLRSLNVEQSLIYSGFLGLYNIVHTYNYLGQGYYQQALRSFYRLMLIIIGNPEEFSGIKSMSDEFCKDNAAGEAETFLISLRQSFAIDQFLKDMEELHDLEGLHEIYGSLDNLEEYVKSYNDVITCIREKERFKNDAVLLNLPYIKKEDFSPPEDLRKLARERLSDIRLFNDRITSTEFFDAYIARR